MSEYPDMMNADGNREKSRGMDPIGSSVNTAPLGLHPLASNQSAVQANIFQPNVTNWPPVSSHSNTNINLPQQASTTQTPAGTYPTADTNIPARAFPPSQPAVHQTPTGTGPSQSSVTNSPYAGNIPPANTSSAHATHMSYQFPLTYFDPRGPIPSIVLSIQPTRHGRPRWYCIECSPKTTHSLHTPN